MSPLTGVLTEAWDLYRRYAKHFLAISFAVYLVAAVITAVLNLISPIAGGLLGAIITLVALFLVQAALVKAVQDVRDGRVDMDFGQTLRAAVPFVAPVAGASILAAIGIVIGLVLLIVPGLILLTFWLLIVPAIVVGGSAAMDSFGHSYRTVKGYGWNVFGTYILTVLILFAVEFVLGLILIALPLVARSFLSEVIAGTITAPFAALVITLIYYRLTAAHAGAAPAGGGYAPGAPAGGGYPGGPTGAAAESGGGYQPPPPAGTGYEPAAPAGTGYEPAAPAGTGYEPPAPAGTGYEPPAPAGTGYTQPYTSPAPSPGAAPPPAPSPGGYGQPATEPPAYGEEEQPPPARQP